MDRHIPTAIAAKFIWHERDGAMRMGIGTTRDLSRNRISILADCMPPPGADVQVIVDIPSSNCRPTVERQLCGKGLVVRVELEEGKPTGFAVEVFVQPGWASLLAQDSSTETSDDDPGKNNLASWLPLPSLTLPLEVPFA